MRRWQGHDDGYLLIGAQTLIALVVLGFASAGALAQDAPAAATESGDPTVATTEPGDPTAPPAEAADAEVEAPVEGEFTPDELQALVAPIALYPDLVLVLVLQASLAPLDVVQADRFLASYAEDPSLTPDADWDEAVIGLLNYPSVVGRMSGDLDWSETLGTAVITQLEGVQDAIQEFRAFMHAIGALESNEQATIIAEGDIIRIEPADENAVFIPEYDPDALLAALYSTDVTPQATPEGDAMAGQEEAVEYDEVTETEEELVATEEEGAVFEPEPVEGAAPFGEAAPVVVPAAAPAYYPAVAPPPVDYSDPSPSWLGTAATFAGGAAVGGLVGWAIADDDDDDDGDRYSRGDIDIEDSTITVNRRDGDELDDLQRRVQDERLDREALQQAQREQAKLKAQNEQLKREARKKEERDEAKRQLKQRYPEKQQRVAATGGAASGLAASGSKQRPAASRESAGTRQVAAKVDRAKAKADPDRRSAAKVRPAKSGKAVRAGDRKQPQVASAFGGNKSARQAKSESNRGVKSRSHAKTAVKPNRSRSGGSAFAQHGGGGKAHAAKQGRGKKSRRGRK